MIPLSRPPYNDKDFAGYAWQKWFSSLYNKFLKDVYTAQYMPNTLNNTGVTIPKGAAVGFAGVLNNNLLIAPYLADSNANPLYFVGITAEAIPSGSVGTVVTFGEVVDGNTASWPIGTILYASPTTPGALTNIRPTAPNVVIVVAAVVSSSSANGLLMVRPTVPLGLDYGSFSDTTVQTPAAINTAYPIKLNTTDVAHGISVVNDGLGNPTRITVRQAGLYSVSVSNQYTSSNASSKDVQTWLSKNGTAIPDSNSYLTLTGNNETKIFSTSYIVSLTAGQYIQIMWATNDLTVSINNIAATGYSPAAPSAIVTVSQIQL